MRTSEKLSQSRGFVSPSYTSDIKQSDASTLLNASTAFMVGKWAWKRLPRAGFFGLLAVGAYVGYRMMKKDQATSFIDKMKLH